jgi:Cof subfamily protein (haloacid dehalogenase superfamily)
MDVRLVALDLDNTLLDGANGLSEANAAAVRRLRAAGVHVVLATGKHPLAFADLARRLGLPGPHVCLNGAALWTPGRQGLSGTPLSAPAARRALRAAARVGLEAARFTARRIVIGPGGDALAAILTAVGEPVLRAPRPLRIRTPVWKLLTLLAAGDPREAQVRRLAAEAADLGVVRTSDQFLEFVPAGSSKGRALRQVQKALGVNASHTVAFGDHMNDLEMLRDAALGVTFTTAPAAVRRVAGRVVPPGPDAVARELATLGL